MAEYALAFGLVFAVNLLPAFGPPTWAVLVFLVFNFDLEPALLVAGGAIAAAGGRFVLATAAGRSRRWFSQRRIEGLEAVRAELLESRFRASAALGLFALSPVPSAQLFIAAGLLRAPLVPLTLAFFSGRVVSYAIYVAAASAASEGLDEIARDALTSPWGIAAQLLLLAGLVALVRVDWVRVLRDRETDERPRGGGRSAATTDNDPGPVRMAGPDTGPSLGPKDAAAD